MKRFIYFIILAMSLTLVFSQGKPCCKNKAGKGKVSCKFNQATIDAAKDGIVTDKLTQTQGNTVVQCPNSANINFADQKKCNGCKSAPWWKFWVKKKQCCNTKV